MTTKIQKFDITILCKVVDNFGDIGFVLRLAREIIALCGERLPLASTATAVSATPSSGESPATPPVLPNIRIVSDNLKSFSLLEPKINPTLDVQNVNGCKIFNWNADAACLSEFRKNPPQIILECFQCGRPDWLENLLFTEKVPNIVNIIMIDYLTAEDYAETFHKLKSLTRSARVQKVNFMPGFTPKTGGLIFNSQESEFSEKKSSNNFNAIMFGYPRDYSPILRSLEKFAKTLKKDGKKLNILLAQGAGFKSFKKAYACKSDFYAQNAVSSSNNISLTELPFLPQTEWDNMLFKSDILFIRGEDSLSRACLSGIPFLWHAYPQTEEYQLVKVNALLEQMKPYFSAEDFCTLQKCWQLYNTTEVNGTDLENALDAFLQKYNSLCKGFKSFSKSLFENGNFAEHLLEFIFSKYKEYYADF